MKVSLSLRNRIALFVGLLLLTLVCIFIATNNQKTKLKVYFLNVGQGDAIYIRMPNGSDMLIDGGPGRSVLRELGNVMPFFDRTIDVVVATHPDADHIGGFPDVFQKYKVNYFVESGLEGKTDLWKELEKRIAEENSERVVVKDGSKINFGNVKFEILAPTFVTQDMETNDASIAGRLVYGENKFMFTGDAPIYIENKIVSEHLPPEIVADVLKAGHHGSKTSSGENFLAAVRPEYTVISAGKDNRYGHPHAAALERLSAIKTKILRTDIVGRILFESDGRVLTSPLAPLLKTGEGK